MITAPGIICWMKKKFYFRKINFRLNQMTGGKTFHSLIIYINAYFFTLGKFFNKLAVIGKDSMYFSGPRGFFMRPA